MVPLLPLQLARHGKGLKGQHVLVGQPGVSGGCGLGAPASHAGGLKAWLGQQRGDLVQSATSAKGEMEQTWGTFCSLSCPGVNRTIPEQSMPKEMVMSFLL